MFERALIVAMPAGALAALAWASGAYFPETWGAVLLVEAILLAVWAIVATQIWIGRSSVILVSSLLVFAAWELLSSTWGVDPDGAVLESERALLYGGAAAVAGLTAGARRADDLVFGVLLGTGAVTLGGLGMHVVESPGERLEAPIGYANAAGIVAAATLLLGIGLATEGPRWRRVVSGTLAVPALVALGLSQSRGALVATAIGSVVLVLGRRSGGRRRARGVPHAAIVGVVALVLMGVVAVVVHEVRDARSTPSSQQGAPSRLLSTSTSYRADYWEVAEAMVRNAPVLGEGAGGFERIWLRDRPQLLYVRDAHNLYLETLAEIGPAGLCVLLVALVVPLVAARRALRLPGLRAACAAYVALLAHAALDWDWELPAVTVCTVLLGAALAQGGDGGPGRPLSPLLRGAVLACATGLGVTAIVVHAGNNAVVAAHEALDRGDAGAALDAAERARLFAPWAAEPWQLRGEAEAAAGRLAAARNHIRRAIREDPESWQAWLALAFASQGADRSRAVDEARALNPLAPELAVFDGDP